MDAPVETPAAAARVDVPIVRRLDGVSVPAAWGAPDLLAPFTDRPAPPSGAREAEVWYGAHPSGPSVVHDAGASIAATALGDTERPDFLVKLLAAGAPLSIQVHPDDATARRGCAADDAAGLALDASERRYVDGSGKPELVRAVGEMRVLCGLRRATESRELLSRLIPDGGDALLEPLARGDAGLLDAVAGLLRADRVTLAVLHAAVADGARDVVARADAAVADGAPVVDGALERVARLALDLQGRFPDDAGTLVALLLEDVDLAPGDALWVAPGTPHAYLSGLGVEVMACSDNVLRAGMTVKHVDVDEFLAVLDPSAIGVPRIGSLARRMDGTGWRRFIAPTDAFVLDEADLDGVLAVERSGAAPEIVLCLTGVVHVEAADGSAADLGPGGAVLLAPGPDAVDLRGRGFVVHVSGLSCSVAPTSG
jgi:mannose-6-phosphate isomerase